MQSPPRIRRFAVRSIVPIGAAFFVGMLFWAKLRVVETIPRSAYAEPDPKESADAAGSREAADDAPEPAEHNVD